MKWQVKKWRSDQVNKLWSEQVKSQGVDQRTSQGVIRRSGDRIRKKNVKRDGVNELMTEWLLSEYNGSKILIRNRWMM